MTYQIIYSSESTMPMQSEDLETLLTHARSRNADAGISGALIYADGVFLQIIEGDRAQVETLMTRIRKDRRHEAVTVLREGEMPSARFERWKMAYIGATSEQVARWAGLRVSSAASEGTRRERRRPRAHHAFRAGHPRAAGSRAPARNHVGTRPRVEAGDPHGP